MKSSYKKGLFIFLSSLLVLDTAFATGLNGCSFNQTRLIIDGGMTSGTIVLSNEGPKDVMVFSKMQNADSQNTPLAQALPRLFSARAGKSSVIRINVDSETLPQDRETQFWLYAKMFNQTIKNTDTRLNFNYINKIKIFYRPAAIGKDLYRAIKNIEWDFQKRHIGLKNSSPFNIYINYVEYNGEKHRIGKMMKPFSDNDLNIKVREKDVEIKWSAVDDYGNDIIFERKFTNR